MTITVLNFDDVIRSEKRKAFEHGRRCTRIQWGEDGYAAMRSIYGKRVHPGFRLFNVEHVFGGRSGEIVATSV
jgi:hypothetical protein